MPKPKPKPTRPIQDRTDAPAFASRIRSPQAPMPKAAAARAAMRALGPLGVLMGAWGGKQRGRRR